MHLVDERLSEDDGHHGYLFDGFPRTLRQAEALDILLEDHGTPLDAVIEFVIPEPELFRRLSRSGAVRTTAKRPFASGFGSTRR